MTVLEKHAFDGTNVKELVLPKYLEVIEDGALDISYQGEEMLVLPSTLVSIGNYGLWGISCDIYVPKSVKKIAKHAFGGTNVYFEVSEMPDEWHSDCAEYAKSVTWGYKYEG